MLAIRLKTFVNTNLENIINNYLKGKMVKGL